MTKSFLEESEGEDQGKLQPAEYKVEKNLLEIKTKCPNGKVVQVKIKVFVQVEEYQGEGEEDEEEISNKSNRIFRGQQNNYSMCDDGDTIVYEDDENDEDTRREENSKNHSRNDSLSMGSQQQEKEKY